MAEEQGTTQGNTQILSAETNTGTRQQTGQQTGSQASATQTAQGEKKDSTILTTPVSIVKPDGTFVEGWRDKLPDGLGNEKCLDTVTDFNNAIKQLVSHKKMVGKDKITVPNEKSTPQEWEAFYSATGRPAKQEDYKTPEIPEDLKEIFDDKRIISAQKTAFELGISQKQFEAYMKHEVEDVKTLLADQDRVDLQAKQDADKALRTEFGAAYDERIHVSNRLVAEAFPNEEERMNFLEEFGNDPNFIRFASRVGSRMTEHTALIAELTRKTPNEAQARIKQLQATPGYMTLDNKMTPEQRQAITDEIHELTRQIFPAKAG